MLVVKLRSKLALLTVCLGCNTAPPKAVKMPIAASAAATNEDARSHKPHEVQPSGDASLPSNTGDGSSTAESFNSAGVAFVAQGSEWHCIDKHRQQLATILTFDNGPDYVVEGLIRYKASGKVGFVDERCTVRITASWDFAFPFSNGRAVVCNGCQSQSDGEHSVLVGGKWGYIDHAGKVVVPLEYDGATTFEDGKGTVTLNGATLEVTRGGVRKAHHRP